MARPKVKICGLTRVEDARLAMELGADYIGLNFHPPSPRAVDLEQARRIADAVRGRVGLVAVVVNAARRRVEELVGALAVDLVQYHGDEGPGEVVPAGAAALKAFRVAPGFDAAELARYPLAWGFLFDCRRPGLYGGTGERWDWGEVAGLGDPRPRFIAGGIGPANVRQALAASGAWGVDVCSGVEAAPGRKDAGLLARLFREVDDA